MRPHRLELQAFGPFPGTEVVEFGDLSEAGVFLLHGATGAGKTTLLDALCYALYGKAPGDRARLRSDHADPTLESRVQLDIGLGADRFRITRTLPWARPKRRGVGVAQVNATVLLERWDGERWETSTTRAEEAGRELADAIGMSADQFFQVVLLPQGGFARFLQAGVDDRAKLLQRLFGTERFRDVEGHLAKRRLAGEHALAGLRRGLDEQRAAVAQAAGLEPDDLEPDDLEPGPVEPSDRGPGEDGASSATGRSVPAAADRAPRGGAWARDLLLLARLADDDAQAEEQDARAEVEDRTATRDAWRERAHRSLARTEVRTAAEVLDERAPGIALLTAELRAARRAAPVEPRITGWRECIAEAAAAAGAAHTAHQTASRYGAPAVASAAELLALAAAQDRRAGVLDALRPLADELAAHRVQTRATEAELARIRAEITALALRAAALPAAQKQAVANAALTRDAERALPTAFARAETYAQAVDTARARDGAAAECASGAAAVAAARERSQSARQTYQDVRQRHLDGVAARLAADLRPGEPCTVCGARDHPQPRAAGSDLVAEDAVRASEKRYDDARTALETEATALTRAQEHHRAAVAGLRILAGDLAGTDAGVALAGADDQAGPDIAGADVGGLAEAHRAAVAAAAALAADAAGQANAEAAVAALIEQAIELAETRAGLDAALQSAAVLAADADARAAHAQARLADELGGAPDLDAALAVVRAESAALGAAADAAAAATRAEKSRVRAASDLAKACTAAGFEGPAQAADALRDDAWVAAAERNSEAHARNVTSNAARAAELGDDEYDAAQIADALGAAQQAVDLTVAGHRAATAAAGVLAQRVAELERLVPRLAAAEAALAPREAEHRRLREVTDLVAGAGANTRQMTLSSYVLAARLEEVAEAASHRLLRMTDGRYELVHADSGVGRERRKGLGLHVRDAWTGQDRETATLSGGETFLASLALALGLADVVTAEAGGTRIETLFIDEGFGTLDENTLDEVMGVLDQLREGGRLVGLVSHVAELRQRIPTRIEVRKTPTGSTLRAAS